MTWSTNEPMSLLVENPERLPDLVLDLGVLDLPEKLIFTKFILNPTHLVISQTNSLKLIEPFPSWSISPISSWKTKESKFMIDGLFLLFQPDQIREICSSIVRSMGCSTIFKIKPFCVFWFCFSVFSSSPAAPSQMGSIQRFASPGKRRKSHLVIFVEGEKVTW